MPRSLRTVCPRNIPPDIALERPIATGESSTVPLVCSTHPRGAGSVLSRLFSIMRCVGGAGGRTVNLAAETEYQFDLANGLAGCSGHLFERRSRIGEFPNRGIAAL